MREDSLAEELRELKQEKEELEREIKELEEQLRRMLEEKRGLAETIANAFPGTLRKRYIRDSKTGKEYGPYYYLYRRVGGKLKEYYLGKKIPPNYMNPRVYREYQRRLWRVESDIAVQKVAIDIRRERIKRIEEELKEIEAILRGEE